MITNQFIIHLCHFHCSHWQNHLLNFTFREKGPLVLVKTTFSSLFWNKLLIFHASCNGHVPFDMFHHILPQNDTLGFLGENIWMSSIGKCATLGYTAVDLYNVIVSIRATDHVTTMLCHVTENCGWQKHFRFHWYGPILLKAKPASTAAGNVGLHAYS